MLDSASRDSADFREAVAPKLEEDHVAAATEAILLSLQNSAPLEVLILLLDAQVDMGGHHVLELIGAAHLAVLRHLSDDQNIASMLLCVVSK